MRMHFVSVPIHDGAEAEADLNRFLTGHRVLAVERQLVIDGERSAWAICVSYVERAAGTSGGAAAPAVAGEPGKRRSSIDYRDVLADDDFQIFVKLRSLRKALAEKEGVPAYALFTNEQLAAMVRTRARSAADLAKLDGVGKARIEKYGPAFLARLASGETGEPGDEAEDGAA